MTAAVKSAVVHMPMVAADAALRQLIVYLKMQRVNILSIFSCFDFAQLDMELSTKEIGRERERKIFADLYVARRHCGELGNQIFPEIFPHDGALARKPVRYKK